MAKVRGEGLKFKDMVYGKERTERERGRSTRRSMVDLPPMFGPVSRIRFGLPSAPIVILFGIKSSPILQNETCESKAASKRLRGRYFLIKVG
jgi:hypothetical protein